MKRFVFAAVTAGLLVVPSLSKASGDHGSHQASQSAKVVEFTDGEIRKIDAEAGKLTIKHGEIKNLEMPPMTMVFYVKDKALMGGLKVGDKIKFKVVQDGVMFMVTELKVAP